MRTMLCLCSALCCLVLAQRSEAQVVVVGSPVVAAPVVATPVVTAPVVTAPVVVSPTTVASNYGSYSVGYGSLTPTYSALSPVVSTPVVSSTVVTPAPVVAPVSVSTYRPIVPVVSSASYAAYSTYSVPYIVRPKVYVPGEPVRNLIRAVTP